MKVAFTNSCRYLGGAELWQVRFAKFLKEQGDQVYFFVRKGKFSELLKVSGFELEEIPMRFDLDLIGMFHLFLGLRKFQPSAVIFNDQRDLRLGVIVADWAKVPLKIQRKGWSYLKGSFRDRFYYQKLDYVVAVSQAIEKLVREKLNFPAEKIWYLPNGVEVEKFNVCGQEYLRPQEFIIGMVGRLEKQKRQADLIQAGKILLQKGFKFQIVFAGEGKEQENLIRLGKELGLEKCVKFLGFVERIEEFLARLDIFVFCSEWEGMPNAVLEAMASAKPVVATDIEGVRELIEDGKSGLLYPAGKPEALAERIEHLIREPEFRERLGKEARKRVEKHFSEREIFQQFRDQLLKILEARR